MGAELLLALEQRAFALSCLRLFASSRSAGRRLRFRDDAIASAGMSAIRRGAAWLLFVAGDRLRKGAALNAVQIAEKLVG